MSFHLAYAIAATVAFFVAFSTMARLLARISMIERDLRRLVENGRPIERLSVPDGARQLLVQHDPSMVLFVDQDCDACLTALDTVRDWPSDLRSRTTIVAVGGFSSTEPPSGCRIVTADKHVKFLSSALQVSGTPQLLRIEAGMVIDRATGVRPTTEVGDRLLSKEKPAS